MKGIADTGFLVAFAIRMSELYPDLPVITVDGDFRVYRRNGREAIPTLMPPS